MPHGGDSDGLIRCGKVCFADQAAAALLGEHLGALDAPVGPDWQCVKQNPSRTVWRGQIGDQVIYLKHFHSRSLTRKLTRALGVSRARREMALCLHLAAAGIAATPVLACACGEGVEWVASREVAGARPVDAWHEELYRQRDASSRAAIRAAARALAEVVARMHAAGVVHHDLHCGNVLLRQSPDGPELVLMDLHRAAQVRMTRTKRAANLAQVLYDRMDFTTRSGRLRFLKRYIEAGKLEGSLRGWSFLIEQHQLRHARRMQSSRDRRILGNNRYFSKISLAGGWNGHVVLASKRKMSGSHATNLTFDLADWQAVLADLPALLTGPDVAVLKDSRSSLVVRREVAVGPHRVMMHIKQPRRKYMYKLIVDCFRKSRPVRAFRLGHMLLGRRISTALPLAALERRAGPFLTDSILITETVFCPRLHDFFNSHLSSPPSGEQHLAPAQQRQLAQDVLAQMGRLLQRLHDYRFAHRDLKANNMLVHWTPGSPPEIVLVDLDGLRPVRWLTDRRRFQGLMRLNVSLLKCPVVNHAGQLRMLLGYLHRPGAGRIHFKPYWRFLETWSARKLRQQIQSRRNSQATMRQQQEAQESPDRSGSPGQ